MKLLKNRKFAILITVLIVCTATLIGMGVSLDRSARAIEAMFFDGVYLDDEGFTQPGISSHLANRQSSALSFATIMEGYPELAAETEALLVARRALIDASSFPEKHSANEAMQEAFTELVERARNLELAGRDRDDMERFSMSFYGAQTAIDNSRYNQKAAAFMDNASFFAHFLRPVLFVTPPQTFS